MSESVMNRFFTAVVLLSFGLALPAVGQVTSEPAANTESKGEAVTLSEEQKQAVINAAVSAKSRQKTPKEFSPSLGATVPKEVYLHGFRPDETQKTPLLKKYSYAFLDREVVLVDGGKKVVAVIALPEKLVAGAQPHQGAAEASSTNAKGNASPGSVPSHTSPESIK
jgi:hypothetical protein